MTLVLSTRIQKTELQSDFWKKGREEGRGSQRGPPPPQLQGYGAGEKSVGSFSLAPKDGQF